MGVLFLDSIRDPDFTGIRELVILDCLGFGLID